MAQDESGLEASSTITGVAVLRDGSEGSWRIGGKR